MLDETNPIGFYTTRFVEAESEADAEIAAVRVLQADPRLAISEELRTEDAMVFVDEIVAVSEGTPGGSNTGFSFFPMEEGGAGGVAAE